MEQTLGKRIVAHRKRLGLTQDSLAEKLGVTAQAVSKWENDQSCPDITILPKLAEIFGTTTDELLGILREPQATEVAVVTETENRKEDGFHFRNGNWEFKFDKSRNGGIFFAALILLIGALYLLSRFWMWEISLWDIAWSSSLLVWGIYAMQPKFSFLGLGCIIFGGFFLANNFVPVQVHLDSGVVVAVIILLIGGSLLADALGKPQKPLVEFTYNGGSSNQPAQNSFSIDGESFQYIGNYGDHTQLVAMPRLACGRINTSFGDFDIDLSGVQEVAPDCHIDVNASFGDLTILVPKQFQVQHTGRTSPASLEVEGKPDPEFAGLIVLEASVSFGQITVKYI